MKIDRIGSLVLACLLAMALVSPIVFAHGEHNNNKPSNTQPPNDPQLQGSVADATQQTDGAPAPAQPRRVTEFPSYHPLVVHFPIMLILLAAALQVLSLFVFRNEMSWLVMGLSLTGAVTAWLASNTFHPHTAGLTAQAQQLLLEHERFASFSLWLGSAGFAVKGVSHFLTKRHWAGEVIATALLIAAAVAIAVTGHHGAELVHKEGVGPRGDFLQTHDH